MEKAGLEPPSFPRAARRVLTAMNLLPAPKSYLRKCRKQWPAETRTPCNIFERAGRCGSESGRASGSFPAILFHTRRGCIDQGYFEKGESTSVTVAFNAVIHIGSEDMPRETEAVWRFYRADAQDNWRLDSIHA